MSKILSIIAIPLGILISLKYFGIFDINSLITYNIILIGALFLVFLQLFTHISLHITNKGTTAMGKIIKSTLALPGILYAVSIFFPINLGFDLSILIGIILILEGLYGLH